MVRGAKTRAVSSWTDQTPTREPSNLMNDSCSSHARLRTGNRADQPTRVAAIRRLGFLTPQFAVSGWRFLAIACVLPFSAACRAENPFTVWVTSGMPNPYSVVSSALSSSGELYVNGADYYNTTNNVLLRFSPDGQLTSSTSLQGIVVGASVFDSAGNRYVTGTILTNGLFDASQVRGLFVAKYGPSGQLHWVRSQGVNDPAPAVRGSGIAVDSHGSVFAGGYSEGPMTVGQTAFGDGSGPVFCKYDRDGQLLWARRVECTFGGRYPGGFLWGLSADVAGNLLVYGSLNEGTADFGGTTVFPGSTGHAYGGDMYLAKYDPDGNLLWVRLGYGYAGAFAADNQGNLYMPWEWPVDGVLGIVKLNPAGDVLWSKSFPGAETRGIALDPSGDLILAGLFETTAMFEGIIFNTHSSLGYPDFFVAKVDSQGNVKWAISGGGSGPDYARLAGCDPQGNIFLIGGFQTAGTFGGFSLVPTPSAPGGYSLFAAKRAQKPALQLVQSAQDIMLTWPVGATNYVLEAATSLPAISWATVTNTPTVTATNRRVQLPLTGPAQFFRLRKP